MAHRRRGVGVGRSSGPKFSKKAEEMKSMSMQSAMETVEKLEVKLTEFAKKHRNEIQQDPAFRQKFLEMCGPLGVDPLLSKKSFWSNLLGDMSDFYYELAVKVAEVCVATRSRNGGIISITEVSEILTKRGTKFRLAASEEVVSSKKKKKKKQKEELLYSTHDITTAISKLSALGGGFRTIRVGSSTMIVSVPTELDNDHMEIMTLAQDNQGKVSLEQVQDATKWSPERSKRAMDLLLGQGMAWLDVYRGQELYWFPSVWKEGFSVQSG